jgi:flavin-dependent dehydrogenase
MEHAPRGQHGGDGADGSEEHWCETESSYVGRPNTVQKRGGVVDTNTGRGGFCPRRTVLDKLLVDAAVEAGAELREGFTVDRLLWEGDRVIGIGGRTPAGRTRRRTRAAGDRR